jgi:hypothetical protein
MAVWLSLAGRSVVDKAVAIMLPISAFVAAGFEHSVANMYFIPIGILLRDGVDAAQVVGIDTLDWYGYLRDLSKVSRAAAEVQALAGPHRGTSSHGLCRIDALACCERSVSPLQCTELLENTAGTSSRAVRISAASSATD